MKLFTKVNCDKCHYITDKFDLTALGIQEAQLGRGLDDPQPLADLAWHELVEVAEKEMPILTLDDGSYITGAIKIKAYLANLQATRDRDNEM